MKDVADFNIVAIIMITVIFNLVDYKSKVGGCLLGDAWALNMSNMVFRYKFPFKHCIRTSLKHDCILVSLSVHKYTKWTPKAARSVSDYFKDFLIGKADKKLPGKILHRFA